MSGVFLFSISFVIYVFDVLVDMTILWSIFTGCVSGKSDPFCVVRLGTQEQKTDVCDATLNPKWNKKVQPYLKRNFIQFSPLLVTQTIKTCKGCQI